MGRPELVPDHSVVDRYEVRSFPREQLARAYRSEGWDGPDGAPEVDERALFGTKRCLTGWVSDMERCRYSCKQRADLTGRVPLQEFARRSALDRHREHGEGEQVVTGDSVSHSGLVAATPETLEVRPRVSGSVEVGFQMLQCIFFVLRCEKWWLLPDCALHRQTVPKGRSFRCWIERSGPRDRWPQINLQPLHVRAQVPDQVFLSRLRSEEHTSELQSRGHLVCRLLLEKKKRYVL